MNEDGHCNPNDENEEDAAKGKSDGTCDNIAVAPEKTPRHRKKSRLQRFMCFPVRRSVAKGKKDI